MSKRVLQDASGIYWVSAIAAIQPLTIKGNARDQTQVTAVHTAIALAGGQTFHTSIPWDEAKGVCLEAWDPAPKQETPSA